MIDIMISTDYATHDAFLWNMADLSAMLFAFVVGILIFRVYRTAIQKSSNARYNLIRLITVILTIGIGLFVYNNVHIAVRGQDTANATYQMASNEKSAIPKENKIERHDNDVYRHSKYYNLTLKRRKIRKDAISQFNKCDNVENRQKHFDKKVAGLHARPPRFHNYF